MCICNFFFFLRNLTKNQIIKFIGLKILGMDVRTLSRRHKKLDATLPILRLVHSNILQVKQIMPNSPLVGEIFDPVTPTKLIIIINSTGKYFI